MWRYDHDYGYEYVPSIEIARSDIANGRVVGCAKEMPVNDEGNIGPAVPDYDTAELKVAIFGDSFSAFALGGVTWPSLLQSDLEQATGKKVRVLNLARDGFGLLQVVDAAAGKIEAVKPDIAILEFISPLLGRARTWRTVFGSGDGERLVTTTVNSVEPPDAKSTDMELLEPSASPQWCESSQKSDDPNDPVLGNILAKANLLTRATQRANVFDLTSSYLFDRLVRHDPFASQWAKLPPATSPPLEISDFRADGHFLDSVGRIKSSGVPFVIVHLPLGVSIKNDQEFWFEGNASLLLQSLEAATGQQVVRLRPYLNLAPEEAMKICNMPTDCHPSRYGMELYAKAVTAVVLEHLPK
jgi:hypothetical protein